MTDPERRFYETQADRFVNRLAGQVITSEVRLDVLCAVTAQAEPFSRRLSLSYAPVREGEVWGRDWMTGWFRLTGTVPADWAGGCVVARVDLGSEGCVFDNRGMPRGGLSRSSVFDPGSRREILDLYDPAAGSETVDLWVEAVASDPFGIHLQAEPSDDDPRRYGTYEARTGAMRLALVDRTIRSLHLDAAVLLDLMRGLPERNVRRARILRALTAAADAYCDGRGSLDTARAALAEVLAQPAAASACTALAVGHAHIDTGWLWPVHETIRKCARTFSSQIALLRKYPTYVFGASTPQHYAFVKEHYPELYTEIKDAVAGGRWEPLGALWVEADCNIPSGESLVRQILLGKNYWRDEFGVDVRNVWIPDAFGYGASLPQILRRSGVDYFLTQKISWNQFNRFPHHTFRWRGIDGSEVLTHFPPEDTYNSVLSPSSLCRAEQNFEERDRLGEFTVLFGVGDGGGGPLPEHVEAGLRIHNLEGAPRVVFGRAQDFFDRLGPKAQDLPVWQGELYLELHRGTLTTQARTKRMNRILENELRALEHLLCCGPLQDYPWQEMDTIWKRFLLHQFHDILPGSGIRQVYADTEAEHAALRARVRDLVGEAARRCLTPDPESLTLVNCLNEVFDDPVVLPKAWRGCTILSSGGTPVSAQVEEGETVGRPILPPLGSLTLVRGGPAPDTEGSAHRDLVLENDHIRYVFRPDGTLHSAFDKAAGREVLHRPGAGNVLALYNDVPLSWDAWDVDIYYERQCLEVARARRAGWIARGPVRSGLRFEYRVSASMITQNVYLRPDSRRLDFRTQVEWRERRAMLRVSFEVAVTADEASYEIQYGTIRRPTHRNTSREMARFEVCGHRFADLSEDDYGVALLNDCKYGYKVLGHTLDLNLLRSPVHPDPDADRGEHVFTYCLLPHTGRLSVSDVYHEASKLNQGVLLVDGYRGHLPCPCSVEGVGVMLGTLKRAEKEPCWVARIYERRGRRARGRLRAPGHWIVETDLMEWHTRSTGPDGASGCGDSGSVEVTLGPFEIRTYKLVPQG